MKGETAQISEHVTPFAHLLNYLNGDIKHSSWREIHEASLFGTGINVFLPLRRLRKHIVPPAMALKIDHRVTRFRYTFILPRDIGLAWLKTVSLLNSDTRLLVLVHEGAGQVLVMILSFLFYSTAMGALPGLSRNSLFSNLIMCVTVQALLRNPVCFPHISLE